MTDAELRDLAVDALKRTTVSYPTWLQRKTQGKYKNDGADTEWGKAFNYLAQIEAAPPPPPPPPPLPPPAGVPVPAFECLLTADAIPQVGSQSWVICTSNNIPTGSWGGGSIRQIRTPMDTGGGGSWEWWCAYEVMIDPSWNDSNEGSTSSTPHDWHDCPGQPGWEGQPWDSKYGVSPVHVRLRDGSYNIAHEPNGYPNHQFPIVPRSAVTKGVWHSVMLRIIFGRTDGRIPANGHPNGGKGRTYAAWDGQWKLDTGDISNLWYASESGKFTTRMDILEGGYYVGGMPAGHNHRFTLARFGRTKQECLEDKGWSNIVIYRQGGGPPEGWTGQPVISRIADRSTSNFISPP